MFIKLTEVIGFDSETGYRSAPLVVNINHIISVHSDTANQGTKACITTIDEEKFEVIESVEEVETLIKKEK